MEVVRAAETRAGIEKLARHDLRRSYARLCLAPGITSDNAESVRKSDESRYWGDASAAEMKRARQLDPLSLVVNATLGRVYRDARQYVQALGQCRKTLDLDPNIPIGHWCLGQVYIGEHRYAPAIQELELAKALGTTPLIIRDLAWVYAAVGNKTKANAILDGLMQKAQPEYMSPYSIGVIHAALGQKDDAFRYLNRAFAERDSQITYLALDPELDPLRSDPRFEGLLEQLHIPR